MTTPPTTGGVTQPASTAHWTAIIATSAVSLCFIIVTIGLASVVIRDGNSTLVAQAMQSFVSIGEGLAAVLGFLVGAPQLVSAFIGRFQTGVISSAAVPPEAPPAA